MDLRVLVYYLFDYFTSNEQQCYINVVINKQLLLLFIPCTHYKICVRNFQRHLRTLHASAEKLARLLQGPNLHNCRSFSGIPKAVQTLTRIYFISCALWSLHCNWKGQWATYTLETLCMKRTLFFLSQYLEEQSTDHSSPSSPAPSSPNALTS